MNRKLDLPDPAVAVAPRPMARDLVRWLSICAVFLAVAALVVLAWGAQSAQRTRQDAVNWEAHSLQVMLASERLLSAYLDGETGQRGYVLTQDKTYLEPLTAARTVGAAQELRLIELTKDNPAQVRNVEALGVLNRLRVRQFDQVVALAQAGKVNAARDRILSGQGKTAMEAIRARTALIGAEEQRRLAIRRADAIAATSTSETYTGLLSGVGVLLILATGALAVTLVRRREGALVERTRAEVADVVRLNRDLLQTVIDGSHDPIFAKDLSGAFVLANRRMGEVYGVRPQDMLGRFDRDFAEPDVADALTRVDQEVMASGQAQTVEEAVPERGEMRIFLSSKVPWRVDDKVVGVIGIARDVTEMKQAERVLVAANDELEVRVRARTSDLQDALADATSQAGQRAAAEAQMRQMQKMESIGQLTGGIAHDFNNMLAIVVGSLDMARRRLNGSEDPKVRVCIDNAGEGATRAAGLTARLLAFSRQQPLAPEALDPNKLVSGMSELLRRTLGDHIRIETVLAGGLWAAFADAAQLESAIVNLAVNGRDAMSEGGKLTIETSNAHLDDSYVAGELELEAGQYVLISVSDSGTGMAPDVAAKAFDPFYTTKDVGKGTGLGLSQVFGFIKQSGGHIKIYSEVGHGTTLKIYLPRYSGLIVDAIKPTQETTPLGDLSQIILVVEDEAKVRHMAVDALRELGYTVVQAENGQQALEQLTLQPAISMLFTDIVMPDMNGRLLAEEALKRRPDLKVLYTTGYTRNAVVHNGMLDVGVAFLSKPYTFEQLARKVRDVMRDAGANRLKVAT